jgi:hypothetical protein
MKLAIMQPYFFPYLGYFQLINAVDCFVIHDDAQYIKGGWINKNRILLNNDYFNIGIPLRHDSSTKRINERYFIGDTKKFKLKVIRQIENAYRIAPNFKQVFPFISELVRFEEINLSKYNTYCLSECCKFLMIKTPFYLSSEINKLGGTKGDERVININHEMGAEIYINPVGGVNLYNKDSFRKEEIELKFLISEDHAYKQFSDDFVPNMSIIDLLMFNSIESTKKLLKQYHLE